MSEFNVTTTTEIMSEEDAAKLLHDSFYVYSEETVAEHEMLVDAVQLLTLAGKTLDQVAATAIALAKSENNYGIGRVFDAFTTDQLRYGRHVVAAVMALTPSTVVTRAMAYAGKYSKSRPQIMINSELMTDDGTGLTFYEYMRSNHYVTANVHTPWEAFNTKNGAKRRLRLYTHDGKFYTIKDGKKIGVALGSPVAFDTVINSAHVSGEVATYTTNLNKIPQDLIETLSENQQQLFLEVFKNLK
jgi:hypothetical protein